MKRFAHYYIKSRVSINSEYEIWIADNISNGRTELLKLISNATADSTKNDRFRHEYDLLHGFPKNHPSRSIGLLKDEKGIALAFARSDHLPLERYMPAGVPIALDRFFPLALGLASALGELHSLHIIHRNIKPSNIMIHPETGSLYLTNFEMATRLDVHRQEIQNLDRLVGSLEYMSPEQTGRMDCTIDYRTDFYSLGVTLYQSLTGHLPFNPDDDIGMVACHLAKMPENPCHSNPDIPAMVGNIILKLMEKDKTKRYQSSHGLRHDLEICSQAFRDSRAIPDFKLGTKDMPNRFVVSGKLHGRDRQLKQLQDAFESVKNGQSSFVLVSGYSGVGKTALIDQFHMSLLKTEKLFISGKFDKFQQDIAYSAISKAFQSLVDQLLTASDTEFNDWADRTIHAVAPLGRLIIDIVPQMKFLIGDQPEVAQLDATQAQTRLGFLFSRLIKVFARPEHPLVLFIDDLQWADGASLKLLESMATEVDIGSFLIIGAYRDNEVDDNHPLTVMIKRIEQFSPIERIQLLPLPEIAVLQMVSETLHAPARIVSPMAAVIYNKTGGNPFFVTEFLKMLFWEGGFHFNESRGVWEWETDVINQKELSDNVVEFMLARLRTFPPDTQAILHIGSCMGDTFDLEVLSRVAGKDWADCGGLLEPVLKQGHLIPQTEACSMAGQKYTDYRNGAYPDARYMFLHDRIQEAAYALAAEGDRQKTHLAIARILHRRRKSESKPVPADEIARHYKKAMNLLKDEHERQTVAEINVEAARQAMKTNSFKEALEFSRTALSLFPDTIWEDQYGLAWETHYIASESSFLRVETRQGEVLLDDLMAHSATALERLTATLMAARRYNTMTMFDKTLQAGIHGLEAAGIRYNRFPGIVTVAVMLIRYRLLLRLTDKKKRVIQNRICRPMDPQDKVVCQILTELSHAAFSIRNFFLIPYSACRVAINLSQCRTLTPELFSFMCVWFSCGSQIFFKDYTSARKWVAFSKEVLGQDLSESDSPDVLHLFGFYLTPYQDSWPVAHTAFRRGRDLMIGTGVPVTTIHATAVFYEGQWNFISINQMLPEYETNIKIIERFGNIDTLLSARSYLIFLKRVGGKLPEGETPYRLWDSIVEQSLETDSYAAGYAYLHMGIVAWTREDYSFAVECFKKANSYLRLFGSTFFEVDLTLFGFLAAGALYPKAEFRERVRLKIAMALAHKKINIWSAHNPDNFLHLKLLMNATRLSLKGRLAHATTIYEKALQTAENGGFRLYAGIIQEQIAILYQKQGLLKDAARHIQIASAEFEYLGWNIKVASLRNKSIELSGLGSTHRRNQGLVAEATIP